MTTPTLMTADEMRAYLIEKRRLQLEEAAEFARQGAERRKVWAAVALAPMLETLMAGTREDSAACESGDDADAIVLLARSLGYVAHIDREADTFYAVVKGPAFTDEDAAPTVKMRVHCDEYHAHRESCMVPDGVAS